LQAGRPDALENILRLAYADALLYATILLSIALPSQDAFRRARGEPATKPGLRHAVLCAAAFVAAFALSWTNLNSARADRISCRGSQYDARGNFAVAAALYEAASRLQPSEEVFAIAAGRAYTERARNAIEAGSATPESD